MSGKNHAVTFSAKKGTTYECDPTELTRVAGGEHGLSAAVVAKLDEARKGVKPGVKPGKASA